MISTLKELGEFVKELPVAKESSRKTVRNSITCLPWPPETVQSVISLYLDDQSINFNSAWHGLNPKDIEEIIDELNI